MMKSSFAFCLCTLLCACGCSRHQGEHCFKTRRSWNEKRDEMVQNVCVARSFRYVVPEPDNSDERFFLTYELSEPPSSSPSPLPYGYIQASVHLPPLRPNSRCVLYCPCTGCPIQPEMAVEYQTDSEGNPVLAELFDELQKNNITMSMDQCVMLYANPGYCSDWYLMYHEPPYSIIHTTFTYKPITASDSEGRVLTIQKWEPGGNYQEVLLRGFQPKQRIILNIRSGWKTKNEELYTGEDGSLSRFILPYVPWPSRGTLYATVSYDGGSLCASCDWDISTLDIKREQPPSSMWKFLCFLRDGQKAIARRG